MRESNVLLPITRHRGTALGDVELLRGDRAERALIAAAAISSSDTVDSSATGALLGAGERQGSSRAAGRPERSPSEPVFERSICGGSARAWRSPTSSDARIPAIGVRSSCEALATNRRCASNAASSRSSSPSIVSASSLSSSSGPAAQGGRGGCPRRSGGFSPSSCATAPARGRRPAQPSTAESHTHDRQRDRGLHEQLMQIDRVRVAIIPGRPPVCSSCR